jgi:hypothetical protein
MTEFKKAEIERLEKHREKLGKKRDRMTREIDEEIEVVDRMLTALRSRKSNGTGPKRTGKNTASIKGSKSELANYLYKLLGEYEEIRFDEIVEFVSEATTKGALSKKYSNGAVGGSLSMYSCFVNVRKGVWKLGRSR